jgi:small-conductance mechanosensitive channel
VTAALRAFRAVLLLGQANPSRATSLLRDMLGDVRPRSIIVVVVMLIAAGILARLVNSMIRRRIERHRANGTLLPESATRLQISRRILDALIWVVAIAICLTQFPELRVFSAGLLASAGVSGIIVGFAARSSLGNAVAGVTIAFAQPVRIGDDVELRGQRGTIEDITLLYTYVRLLDGTRLIVPNDTLSTEVLKNMTLASPSRTVRVEIVVPLNANARGLTEAILGVAAAELGVDRQVAQPRLEVLRVDAAGALVRFSATCTDTSSAQRLRQAVLAKAAQVIYGIQAA